MPSLGTSRWLIGNWPTYSNERIRNGLISLPHFKRDLDTSHQYDENSKYIIRVVVAIVSSLSALSTLATLYWFIRMQQRFRHKLIMLFMIGAFVRAIGYLAFSSASFAIGPTVSDSPVCEVSGCLIQWGIEANDFTALCMAVHMGLQVFKSQSSSRFSEGLYNFRYYVYALIVGLPSILVSLAFVRRDMKYSPQGAFCSLPIRPLWYRLVLAWIPRYIIMIVIVALAIALYIHIGLTFRSFERQQAKSEAGVSVSFDMPPSTAPSHGHDQEDEKLPEASQKVGENQGVTQVQRPRQHSLPQSCVRPESSGLLTTPTRSRRASFAALPTEIIELPPESPERPTSEYIAPDAEQAQLPGNQKRLSVLSNKFLTTRRVSNSASIAPITGGDCNPFEERADKTAAARSRNTINRQLRMLFVYPGIYVAMWIFPSVLTFLQYRDEYATSPPYFLSLLNFICLSAMGLVDAVVFCFREKPWRRIPGSDGTLLGSLAFWRHLNPDGEGGLHMRRLTASSVAVSTRTAVAKAGKHVGCEAPRTGSKGSAGDSISSSRPPRSASVATNIPPSRAAEKPRLSGIWRPSGQTESQKAAAELAYGRLAAEKADSRRSIGAASNVLGGGNADDELGLERPKYLTQRQGTEWWDRDFEE